MNGCLTRDRSARAARRGVAWLLLAALTLTVGCAGASRSGKDGTQERNRRTRELERSTRGHDPGVARTICRVTKEQKASTRVRLAAFEAALVESGMRNLRGGHGDSVGVFQQTHYWGPVPERRNPALATKKFVKAAKALERQRTEITPGTLAADVQKPAEQFRWKYHTRREDAEYLIGKYCGPKSRT